MKKCPFCAEDIQDAAVVCKHCRRDLPVEGAPIIVKAATVGKVDIVQAKKKNKTRDSLIAVCIVVGGIYYAWMKPAPTTTVQSQTPVSAPAIAPKESAMSNMKLDFSWTKEGFGNIMQATFTVHNQNAFPVKDIAVRCVSSASSGTKIDTNNRVIYERFEPRDVKQIKDFNMGFLNSQATSTSCSITDLVIIN